jgi:hypothetical protein
VPLEAARNETNNPTWVCTILKIETALMRVTTSARMIPILKEGISMVSTRSSCAIIARAKVVSVANTIVISDGGGGISILVILVKPVVGLKMLERNAETITLNSRVMCDSFFNTVLMVTLKAYPEWALLLVVSELPTHTFLCIVVAINVFLIRLRNNGLWISCIIRVE